MPAHRFLPIVALATILPLTLPAQGEPVRLRPRETIDQLVARLPPAEVGTAGRVPALGATSRFIGTQSCAYQPYTETVHQTQLAAFAPNASTLWPGSIVEGASVARGIFTPIALPRAKGRITVTNIGESQDDQRSASAEIADPSLATVTDGVRALSRRLAPTATPARISHEVSEFHSMSHAYVKLGATYAWTTGSVRAELERQTTQDRNNLMLTFVQAYYDVSFNPPSRPRDLFRRGLFSTVTAEDLLPHVQPRDGRPNPPVMIGTVTYGRMFVLFASSERSSAELRASLEAVYSAVASNGRLTLDAGQKEVLQQSELRLLALGGGAGSVVSLLNGTTVVGDLTSYFTQGATFSPASPPVPISMVLRYLTGAAAKVDLVTNYTTRECRPKAITHVAVRFHTTDDDKDPGDLVSASITVGGLEVASIPEFARRHHGWDDNTSQPAPDDPQFGRPGWFVVPVARPFAVSDWCHRRIVIRKEGNRGWHANAFFGILTEDGVFLPDVDAMHDMKLGADSGGRGAEAVKEPSC